MKAFENPDIGNSFLISVARTGITTVLSVVLTALMAYGLSIKGLPGRKYIVFYFFFTTLFAGGLIPTFILYRQMGLLNNFWVFVIPGLFSFYNTIVTKTFFDGVPSSLSESARIDGASELIIFAKILLPLSMPVLATIALFVGVGNWNDWFAGAFYIQFNRKLIPASTLLYQLIAEATFESSQATGGAGSSLLQGNQQLLQERSLRHHARIAAHDIRHHHRYPDHLRVSLPAAFLREGRNGRLAERVIHAHHSQANCLLMN